ncbi:hypothetical protein [Saccharibacter floricola]|uniref:Uncharacterized protein n=1 Tax=Saccharibacter floricola DSM 15669 TaxID=1123227 RepID=A0ABQ0NZW7_9PROT|nr:hypothetical protein [Saccharibacter floricola]GBQ07506.1 hypothetical protein AA15669_1409 [Saccharibacter floricola DSM 15669]
MLNAAENHSSFSAPVEAQDTSIGAALNELYDIQATLDSLSQGDEPVRAVAVAYLAKRLEYVHDGLEMGIPRSMRSVQGGAA